LPLPPATAPTARLTRWTHPRAPRTPKTPCECATLLGYGLHHPPLSSAMAATARLKLGAVMRPSLPPHAPGAAPATLQHATAPLAAMQWLPLGGGHSGPGRMLIPYALQEMLERQTPTSAGAATACTQPAPPRAGSSSRVCRCWPKTPSSASSPPSVIPKHTIVTLVTILAQQEVVWLLFAGGQ
jgi:hypothetical protein